MTSVAPITPVTVDMLIASSIEGCLPGNRDCKVSDYVPKRKVIIFLDRSGSTVEPMTMGGVSTTVWDFQRRVLEKLVLANPQNTYSLITFDHEITGAEDKSGPGIMPMCITTDDPLVLPGHTDYKGPRRGCTITHLALEFFKNHPEFHEAYIITDGKTDSLSSQVMSAMNGVTRPISIIAVSPNSMNLDDASERKSQTLPGLDIVNLVGDKVADLTVYNPGSGMSLIVEQKARAFISSTLWEHISRARLSVSCNNCCSKLTEQQTLMQLLISGATVSSLWRCAQQLALC